MHGRQNLVVYIGLSANGSREAHELSLLGNHVLFVGPGRFFGHVYIGHRNFDLTQESDISAFASSLGLPKARASALADALATAGISSRDVLGQLAIIWAQAERTHTLPGRMALSGEHAAPLFWRRHGGAMLGTADIKSVAAVFPAAAGAVEDLYRPPAAPHPT